MNHQITIRDVAEKAGVSVATVSRILNGSDKVSESTRQKVMLIIKELDYALHPTAQRLRLGYTNTIATVLPFLTLPSIVERLRGVQAALAESQYDLIPFSVGSPESRDAKLFDLSRKSRADGLLVISMPITDKQVDRLIRNQMPVVLIDSYHPKLNCVNVDDELGGKIATQHLLDLGHKKIAFISSYLKNPLQFSSTLNRFRGYCKALRQAGLKINPDYQRQGEHGREEAKEMAMDLLTQIYPPTAIFASSDTKAIGVLDAARELNISVPNQLSVIGFDDIRDSEYLNLTTIHQPLFDAGLEGGRMLLKLFKNPDVNPEEKILPLELVLRGTTAPPG